MDYKFFLNLAAHEKLMQIIEYMQEHELTVWNMLFGIFASSPVLILAWLVVLLILLIVYWLPALILQKVFSQYFPKFKWAIGLLMCIHLPMVFILLYLILWYHQVYKRIHFVAPNIMIRPETTPQA